MGISLYIFQYLTFYGPVFLLPVSAGNTMYEYFTSISAQFYICTEKWQRWWNAAKQTSMP